MKQQFPIVFRRQDEKPKEAFKTRTWIFFSAGMIQRFIAQFLQYDMRLLV